MAGADAAAVIARPKFYTPYEVSLHNHEDDLWVSFLGNVYSLTPLVAAHHSSVLAEPIVAVAGTDISHWFNAKTKDLRTCVDPITGCTVPYTPGGRFIHVPPPVPRTDHATNIPRPWWKDSTYRVGKLTKRKRTLRVVNILSSQETLIDVCTEETIGEIQERYRMHNKHTNSYTWKHGGKVLDMNQTLDENGVVDEFERFQKLSIDATDEACIAEVQVYYNDDLTEG
mmetsp:Transcript_28411/g.74646  ORF Transcript_28411/g.74646 Transcript_28411/m.74646 type:complete len:227 (-) Transcript_28411:126-806(-)